MASLVSIQLGVFCLFICMCYANDLMHIGVVIIAFSFYFYMIPAPDKLQNWEVQEVIHFGGNKTTQWILLMCT